MKKKIQIAKDLSLDKETVANLNEDQLNEVAGGAAAGTIIGVCSWIGLCSGSCAAEDVEAAVAADGSCCKESCNGQQVAE